MKEKLFKNISTNANYCMVCIKLSYDLLTTLSRLLFNINCLKLISHTFFLCVKDYNYIINRNIQLNIITFILINYFYYYRRHYSLVDDDSHQFCNRTFVLAATISVWSRIPIWCAVSTHEKHHLRASFIRYLSEHDTSRR